MATTTAAREHGAGAWARWLTAAFGVWLVISPFVLAYDAPEARNNDLWIGIVVIAASLVALAIPWVRFVDSLAGIWLVIAPFALDYTSRTAVWNDVILGVAVFVVSLVPNAKVARRLRAREPIRTT